jgi:hypothetical protein
LRRHSQSTKVPRPPGNGAPAAANNGVRHIVLTACF